MNCLGCGLHTSKRDLCSDCISEGCVIDSDGTIIWFNKKREFHREDGPAVEYISGTKKWWLNGGIRYTKAEFDKKMGVGTK